MSDNSYEMDSNTCISFRMLISLLVFVLLYLTTVFDDKYKKHISIAFLFALVGLIGLVGFAELGTFIGFDRCLGRYKCIDIDEKSIEGFSKNDRLNKLNSERGELGQFHVNCKGCGRKKILNERINSDLCGRYQSIDPSEKSTACNRSNRSYCINDCSDGSIGRNTVSLWNNDYIDIYNTFCYNCALDLKSNVLNTAMTYRELPAQSNGPPGYSVYRDYGYTI